MIILNFLKEHWSKLLIGGAVLAVIIYILVLFAQIKNLSEQNLSNLESAYNQIAALSETVQENERTWSRLAQQTEDQAEQLEVRNVELAEIIEARDEQIQSLTTAVARIRDIHVVIDGPAATETRVEDRVRVDFDQTYHESVRVTGYTLSNPAYAELAIFFNRPINFTVVTTQTEDGQWRTYLTSDFEDLQIGTIDSSVNPQIVSIQQQAHQRSWEDGFEVGIFGGVGVSGQAGSVGATLGYDFGSISVGLNAAGIFYPGGGDILIGVYGSLNVFDL